MTAVTEARPADTMSHHTEDSPKRVAYLLGAGATEGAIRHAGSDTTQLMKNMATDLQEQMRALVETDSPPDPALQRLVNGLDETEAADFEQLITFLEDAPSERMRRVGRDLQAAFSDVLLRRLEGLTDAAEDRLVGLFAAVIDMHYIEGAEPLAGLITLNYDTFVERALTDKLALRINYGFGGLGANHGRQVPLLKLHGSFGWRDEWPIKVTNNYSDALWIPPGIRKLKARYPFNSLWGAALDLLDCDILRIVGCDLGANDWDLVSLIFFAKYGHSTRSTLEIEVVGYPADARAIQKRFPFLQVKSLYELDEIGPWLLSAMTDSVVPYEEREPEERHAADAAFNGNPFQDWFLQKAATLARDLPNLDTPTSTFRNFVDAQSPE